MTVVLDIDHETGDLTQYTSSTTGGGDLAVTSGAALFGSYGLSVTINDTGGIYAYKTLTKAAVFRVRFYIKRTTLAMASGDAFLLSNFQQAGGSYSGMILLRLQQTSGVYYISADVKNDALSSVLYDSETLDGDAHCVEYQVVRAANSTSADGTFEWWIDGVSKGTASGIDNYNLLSDQNWRILFGAIESIDAGTSGVFYVDAIKGNDDGAEIGMISVGRPSYAFAQQ